MSRRKRRGLRARVRMQAVSCANNSRKPVRRRFRADACPVVGDILTLPCPGCCIAASQDFCSQSWSCVRSSPSDLCRQWNAVSHSEFSFAPRGALRPPFCAMARTVVVLPPLPLMIGPVSTRSRARLRLHPSLLHRSFPPSSSAKSRRLSSDLLPYRRSFVRNRRAHRLRSSKYAFNLI